MFACETIKKGKEKHWGNVRGSSQVLKFWEFAQKCMHRLVARGLLPGANVETVILCGCEVQCWFWDILMSSC